MHWPRLILVLFPNMLLQPHNEDVGSVITRLWMLRLSVVRLLGVVLETRPFLVERRTSFGKVDFRAWLAVSNRITTFDLFYKRKSTKRKKKASPLRFHTVLAECNLDSAALTSNHCG